MPHQPRLPFSESTPLDDSEDAPMMLNLVDTWSPEAWCVSIYCLGRLDHQVGDPSAEVTSGPCSFEESFVRGEDPLNTTLWVYALWRPTEHPLPGRWPQTIGLADTIPADPVARQLKGELAFELPTEESLWSAWLRMLRCSELIDEPTRKLVDLAMQASAQMENQRFASGQLAGHAQASLFGAH
jgi:hypothetical protein